VQVLAVQASSLHWIGMNQICMFWDSLVLFVPNDGSTLLFTLLCGYVPCMLTLDPMAHAGRGHILTPTHPPSKKPHA